MEENLRKNSKKRQTINKKKPKQVFTRNNAKMKQ